MIRKQVICHGDMPDHCGVISALNNYTISGHSVVIEGSVSCSKRKEVFKIAFSSFLMSIQGKGFPFS
ncbi:PAAR domain-containing protein [Morganella morganii]|uniref:PAAR domain-containing protein n=1 Tax=Morganella morganii TaxID=582 RepID=UPI0021D15C82|nr:PAAR domain-containing protein [Morganella morganii]MCU6378568.1 PAAR domain-containing protein [Morganella morganii]